jgi:hypothetical protein
MELSLVSVPLVLKAMKPPRIHYEALPKKAGVEAAGARRSEVLASPR